MLRKHLPPRSGEMPWLVLSRTWRLTAGSDTSSKFLFGSLQRLTAEQIHISPILMVSANSMGGVMATMISAPSLVVAGTAIKTHGQEGKTLRYVFFTV
jgi:lactate permease